jgi:hypothetical protein
MTIKHLDTAKRPITPDIADCWTCGSEAGTDRAAVLRHEADGSHTVVYVAAHSPKRPAWRTVALAHLKYKVEPAAVAPTMWCAYPLVPERPDFEVFPTWREAMDYALARVAEHMATADEFAC